MPKTRTTTISLPATMVKQAKTLSRLEQRTMSELFREALRRYAWSRPGAVSRRSQSSEWKEIQSKLGRVSRAGKQTRLSAFIRANRKRH